jgi:antitoxin MazE
MKVAKWGNSLAVRLPAALVEKLNLKEGDEIEVTPRGERVLEISEDERRRQAIERMRKLSVPLPAGYKFDRDELYDRGDRETRYPEKGGGSHEPGAAAD